MSKVVPLEKCTDGAYRRAKEMCRLLKSLPEAKNMPICVTLDLDDHSEPKDSDFGSDRPVAVILFGGKSVQATAFFKENNYPKLVDRDFKEWKNTDYQCVTKARQTIGFCAISDHAGSDHTIARQIVAPNFPRITAVPDFPWTTLCYPEEVFGLTKAQSNGWLDVSRHLRRCAFVLVGFNY